MKTKLLLTIAASTLAFSIALVAQQQSKGPAQPLVSGPNTQAIISKITEIVAIRERVVEAERKLGAGTLRGDSLAEVELAESRIELARARNDREAVLTELTSLVDAHRRRATKMRELAPDRVSPPEADRAEAEYLEAQVRLLRAGD